MPKLRSTEYARYAAFIGGCVRSGLMTQADASIQLVEGFWEIENRQASAAGIDLGQQVSAYQTNASRLGALLEA